VLRHGVHNVRHDATRVTANLTEFVIGLRVVWRVCCPMPASNTHNFLLAMNLARVRNLQYDPTKESAYGSLLMRPKLFAALSGLSKKI
jgi:hypothetical protein